MKNKKTSTVLFGLSVAFFWVGWFLLRGILVSKSIEKAWILLIIFLVSLIVFSMFVILTKNRRKILILAVVIVAGAIVIGFEGLPLMVCFTFLALGLFCVGIKRIKDEQQNKISINLYMTLRRGVPIWCIALSLLISAGFYLYLVQKQETSAIPMVKIDVPQRITDKIIKTAAFFVPQQDFELIVNGVTVDEYLRRSVVLQKGHDNKIFSDISQQSTEETLKEGRKMLSSQFGQELSGSEKMNEVVDRMIEIRIDEIVNGQIPNEPLMPFGAAVALFVVAYSLFWFLGLFVVWTSVFVCYILLKLQIIVINKEQREVEIID